MTSTTPSRRSVRASSAQVHVERERRRSSGSSHASLTSSAATLGGKASRPPAARQILQPAQPLAHETLAPQAHALPIAPDGSGDRADRLPGRQQQGRPGTDDTAVRRGLRASQARQLVSLVVGQHDADRRLG
jgi:hypothetical protein